MNLRDWLECTFCGPKHYSLHKDWKPVFSECIRVIGHRMSIAANNRCSGLTIIITNKITKFADINPPYIFELCTSGDFNEDKRLVDQLISWLIDEKIDVGLEVKQNIEYHGNKDNYYTFRLHLSWKLLSNQGKEKTVCLDKLGKESKTAIEEKEDCHYLEKLGDDSKSVHDLILKKECQNFCDSKTTLDKKLEQSNEDDQYFV